MSKKILIATGIYPPDIGGPATMLDALTSALTDNGFIVKIITYSDVVSDKKELAIQRVSKKSYFSRLKYFWKMLKLASWADVIYATDTYSVGYFAYLIKKLTGRKYIIRFAGDSAWEVATTNNWTTDYIVDFESNKYNAKIEKLKDRRRKVLSGANKVIAVSNFMSNLSQKIGVKLENVKVIYNSVDFIKDDTDDVEIINQISNLKKDAKVIITACRLTSWKGVDGIIKILPKLQEHIGNVVFLILGDGEELENLKKLSIKMGVGGNVKFLGRIRQDKMINYFKESDLFVLNTNYEGLSHTLLEVIKAGAPIVSTNVGGNPEIIQNNKEGFLVEYNDQKGLLEAMVKILSNPDLAEQFSNNAKEKLKMFNWNNTIAETVNLIREI